MTLYVSGACLVSCLFAGLLAPTGAATAGETSLGRSERGLMERAPTRCEIEQGPGFVAAGDGACVWVGGHVRVGLGRGGESADNGWTSGPGARGAMRLNAQDDAGMPNPGAMSGRLRLNDRPGAAIAR